MSAAAYNLILPVGTQVVTRVEHRDRQGQLLCAKGAVGAIADMPTDNSHAYAIKLTTGVCVRLRRHEFSIRKHFQGVDLASAERFLADHNLYNSVIFRCVVGSQAYGLATEGSDVDRRGIYLPPADLQWSLYGVPEQLENKDEEECYWELQKYLVLALKANPNVLEVLYSPLVETCTPIAEQLLSIREIFLSQLVYQTYNSYVLSQFKKMEQDLRNKGTIRWKHAMHLIRLLLSGITVLQEGFVPVRIEQYRDRLLAIKQNQMPWPEVDAWRLSLQEDFDHAFAHTTLPERPDYEKANQFLIWARREQT